MNEKTAAPEHKPLTERELVAYLLWRYNAGGYDDHIAAWRESLKKPGERGARAGADE